MIVSEKDKVRFWSKVQIGSPDDCWEWQAGRSSSGYGVFSIKHSWIGAHVVSFIIHHGYKPDPSKKKLVMHDCENPACVNPKHLLEGDPKSNGNYPGMLAKGRENIKARKWWGSSGESHPRWGMKHSEDTKLKLSKAAKKRGGWHRGLKRTEETKRKLSKIFQGENSARAKLTEQDIVAIRTDNRKQVLIAQVYEIDPSTVSNIKNGRTWKHVL